MLENVVFSIGAAKAGTTWLYHQLRDHPELYFFPEKETHYYFSVNGGFNRLTYPTRYRAFRNYLAFNQQTKVVKLERDVFWYLRYLRGPIDDYWYQTLFTDGLNAKYVSDFSNSTSLLDENGWLHLRRTVRNPKILFTLRKPIDRFWSHMKFHAEWIDMLEEFKQFDVKELNDFANKYNIFNDGRYHRTLNHLQSIFDRNCVKILFFEDAHAKPTRFLNSIEEFLEIESRSYSRENTKKKINESQSIVKPKGFDEYFSNHFEIEYEYLDKQGIRIPNLW